MNIDEVQDLPVHRNEKHCPRCGASINLRVEIVRTRNSQNLGFLVLSCHMCNRVWRTTRLSKGINQVLLPKLREITGGRS
jgi:uncharacterized Zn finger protein